MNETVGAAKAEEIGGAKIVAVGAHSSENIAGGKSVNAGGNVSQSAGGEMKLESKKDLSATTEAKGLVEAADEIKLSCGSASIVMKKSGKIEINGMGRDHAVRRGEGEYRRRRHHHGQGPDGEDQHVRDMLAVTRRRET